MDEAGGGDTFKSQSNVISLYPVKCTVGWVVV